MGHLSGGVSPLLSQARARTSGRWTLPGNVTDVSKQRTPQLIGLAGGPGAGKDTAAGLLVTHYGFQQHSFADPLRDFVYATDPGWALAFDTHGYEYAKWNVEGFRQRLVDVGEAARHYISPSVWLNACLNRCVPVLADGKSVVISDVRYPNEADAIRFEGGIVVAVDRPGHPPESPEAWDVLFNADEYLFNDGSVGDLWGQLDLLMEERLSDG